MLTDDLIAKDEEDLDTPVGFSKEKYSEQVRSEKMTDLEEDNVVNRADIELALTWEKEVDKLRDEFKKKAEEIRDREFNIRRALQERVCYLINMSYLKGYREGISPMDKYTPSKGSYERYLKEDFVLSDDGKCLAFRDDGRYASSDYIIPIDVIVSNDQEKDKRFADYIEAYQLKLSMELDEKNYLDRKKDIEFYQHEFEKSSKKFNSIYKKIYDEYEWRINLDGFKHEGKRLDEIYY